MNRPLQNAIGVAWGTHEVLLYAPVALQGLHKQEMKSLLQNEINWFVSACHVGRKVHGWAIQVAGNQGGAHIMPQFRM